MKVKDHDYAVVVEHEVEDTVTIKIVKYEDSLEEMHRLTHSEIVEHIDPCLYFPTFPYLRHVDCFVDEEGKLNGKYPTIPVYEEHGILVDCLCGSILFIEGNDETGENYGLTLEDAKKVGYGVTWYMKEHPRFDIRNC